MKQYKGNPTTEKQEIATFKPAMNVQIHIKNTGKIPVIFTLENNGEETTRKTIYPDPNHQEILADKNSSAAVWFCKLAANQNDGNCEFEYTINASLA